MSFFSLFCCCSLRPRRHFLPTDSDENAPLIPASDDVQPAARHIIIDQQRMKERLGVIVRAKEGKMVNINAPLPFNLNSSDNNNSHRQPKLSRLRTRSPQPSLDTERQSVISSASASASHELDEDMRWPTLNVRIVRGGSALARGRPITRDTVSHEPGAEGEETGSAPTGAASATDEHRAEVSSGVAGKTGDAARLAGTAFKIQNVGSLSQSWGD